MPVLKTDENAFASRDAVVLDLSDIAEQAKIIKESAQAEADRIIEEARDRVARQADEAHESASREGYEAGRQQGHKAGLEAGRKEAFEAQSKELEELRDHWVSTLASFSKTRVELEAAARQRVLEFALLVAERVVHRAVKVDASVVVDQIVSALDLVFKPVAVTIQIHPEDQPLVEDALPSLVSQFSHLHGISLAPDANIKRGGCIVKYGQGEIDSDLDVQLSRIAQAMLPDRSTDSTTNGDQPLPVDGDG